MDRLRLRDMEQRIASARAVMYGTLGAGFLAVVPWLGWQILPALVWSVLAYRLLTPRIHRSSRPEYPIAASVLNAQVVIGVGIALTGGPRSPALILMLIPVVTLPARFARRGVVAGVVIAVAIILLATVPFDPSAFAADPTYTMAAIASVIAVGGFCDALTRAESQHRADALVDGLTGVPNRKALDALVGRLAGGPLCMVLCDLDHFKQVNDSWGHARGDDVLRDTARLLHATLRTSDAVFRVGGEEFLIVSRDASESSGAALAERLRAALRAAQPGGLPVRASFGVAWSDEPSDPRTFARLFEQADAALYEAKRGGRDRVSVNAAASCERPPAQRRAVRA